MINIVIYGRDNCQDSTIAKNTMDKIDNQAITTVYKKLDTDFTQEELSEKFPDENSFPVITVKMSSDSPEEVITLTNFKMTVDNLVLV